MCQDRERIKGSRTLLTEQSSGTLCRLPRGWALELIPKEVAFSENFSPFLPAHMGPSHQVLASWLVFVPPWTDCDPLPLFSGAKQCHQEGCVEWAPSQRWEQGGAEVGRKHRMS